jgi:predicted SAM-dependent methyltransferase
MTKKLLKLDLGCGANPINGYLGIDIGYKKPNIIQSDVFSYLRKTKRNSVSHIYSRHYLEHET